MSMKRITLLICCAILPLTNLPRQAQASTEMFYPASMCTPLTAEDFDTDSRPNGLYLSSPQSGWQNDAQTEHRKLRCPIPYEFNPNDASSISVRVHLRVLTGDRFFIQLTGYDSALGVTERVNLETNATNALRVDRNGFQVYELTLDRDDVPNIRFLELDVIVPDKSGEGRHQRVNSVLGYRVFRGSP